MFEAFEIDKCDILLSAGQDIWFNTPEAFDEWIAKCEPHINDVCSIGSKTC